MRRFLPLLALCVALMGLVVMPVMAQNAGNVVEVLQGDEEGRFSALVSAVVAAGLDEALATGGPFTVFAPTNDAFAAALAALGDAGGDVIANPELLAMVLQYHVVPARVTAATLSFGRSTQNTLLDGATLNVSGSRRGVTVNDSARVVEADIQASNGLIHAIDAVLVPPDVMAMLAGDTAADAAVQGQTEPRPTLAEVLTTDPNQRFTTLLGAVAAAGLTDALNAEGTLTLLAPTNAAFDLVFDTYGITVSEVVNDPALLTAILTYHVLPERTRTSDLFVGGDYATLQGEAVTFAENEAGQLTANGVVISQGNLQASNGVAHVLDGLLVPPTILAVLSEPVAPPIVEAPVRPNLVSVLEGDEDGRFSTLVAAIDAAGLRPLLNSSSEYTIFAPTNDAITASLTAVGMSAEQLLADTNTLQEILLYHVAPGRIRSSDLFRGETLRTMAGQDLPTGENEAGQLTVGGVIVGQANIAAGNGFIHVLDAGILVPPSLAETLTPPAEVVVEEPAAPADTRPTVAQILADDADGRFTTLLAAVEAAGLTDTLTGEGTFTVLAPTNDAFAAALDYLGTDAATLLGNTELLTQVLTYHVLGERTRSSNLFVGGDYTTLNGATLTFGEAANGTLAINGGAATIGDANLVGSNGVVHVIDAVLLPPDVAATAQANRAHVRVAHFSPDAGPIDIYINGQLSDLQGVTFGAISDWLEVPARTYNIAIAPSGQYPIGVASYDVQPGGWVTIGAIGTITRGTLNVQFVEEDYSPIPAGQVRLTVFNAIEGVSTVDVRLNGSTIIAALGYPGVFGDNDGADTVTIGGVTYNVEIVLSGTGTSLLTTQQGLTSGNNYLLGLIGTPDNARFVLKTVAP
ncbi:MAG: fasciclin domain-containing protein [Chloroflexota bacterium]|nr:fasciclin domain-containing protein [Chloroflexota bacterium]